MHRATKRLALCTVASRPQLEVYNLPEPAQVHKAKLLGRPAVGRGRWWRRSSGAPEPELAPASLAAAQALQSRDAPKDGVVAVKVRRSTSHAMHMGKTTSFAHSDRAEENNVDSKWVASSKTASVPQIQYPDALETMSLDLKNIRLAASYLSKAELKFDLVSPVRPCPRGAHNVWNIR